MPAKIIKAYGNPVVSNIRASINLWQAHRLSRSKFQSSETIMVNFMFIPLTDPKLTPELKARFLNVNQLIKWELTDSYGVYTGLIVVGEKPHPQGFQSTTEITFDIPEEETSAAKMQQISRLVHAEFVQRGVAGIKK